MNSNQDVAPYWLCWAMAEKLEHVECEREDDECRNSPDCITEWCAPCAGRAWLNGEREKMRPKSIPEAIAKARGGPPPTPRIGYA